MNEDIKKAIELPLEDKIEFSKSVIREWYNHWDGNVFVAFSGGKDSTVLLHLVRSVYPEVKGVFSNTGLEYPEIYDFAKNTPNVEIIQPRKKFTQVLKEDGFPISNKKRARQIKQLQHANKKNFNTRRLALIGYATKKGIFNKQSKISNKWFPIALGDVKVTDVCCDYLKKEPLHIFKKENTKMKSYNGMMLGEGNSRDIALINRACNMFDNAEPTSIPLKFWTDDNVWEYAEKNNIEICSVYKDYNLARTGCTFCGYGADLEDKNNNRFTKLRDSHPKQFNIFVHKFGMNKALDYVGINYGEEPTYEKPPMPEYACSECGVIHPMTEIGFITEREWTEQEEINKPPLAGMNLFCESCATSLGLPTYQSTKIDLFNNN